MVLPVKAATAAQAKSPADGIVERREHGTLVLSPARGKIHRRILHVNSYGGQDVWERIRSGLVPAHQLLGCLELVRMGYEVAVAEPIPDFYFHRRPVPHDLKLLRLVRTWLGRDGIVFCGHNVLYWLPVLRGLGAIKSPVISLLYAREPLNLASAHQGVIALTPAAAEQARKLAPQARVENLGWGMDLDFLPYLPYRPDWFFSCGIANRDFATLSAAAAISKRPIRVVCPGLPSGITWASNVTVLDGGAGWNIDKTKRFTQVDLIQDHFSRSAATLVIMKSDPTEYTANGFTNLLEAMALGQPVIMTRTGAVPGEIDVEKSGCGLHVPAGDSQGLAEAIDVLANDPAKAAAMGRRGRQLCEEYYNLDRYARDLHRFFESL